VAILKSLQAAEEFCSKQNEQEEILLPEHQRYTDKLLLADDMLLVKMELKMFRGMMDSLKQRFKVFLCKFS